MGYLLVIASRVMQNIISSVGTHLCLTVSGVFFLAGPVAFAASAYVMVILQKAGMSLPLALSLSMVFSVFLAGFYALAYTKMSNDSYAVLTLTSIVAAEALVKSWDSMTGGVMGIAGVARPEFFSKMPQLVAALFVVTLLVLAFEYILLRTGFGRQLRALKENKTALCSLGTSDKKTGALVVALAVMLAAIEGVFGVWRIQYLDPSFVGVYILLVTMTIAILAHKPKVLYLVLAALFVVLVPEALRFFEFSSVILGHIRILLYSIFVIVMIRFLSKGNVVSDRSY